jgi:hypothetical protein
VETKAVQIQDRNSSVSNVPDCNQIQRRIVTTFEFLSNTLIEQPALTTSRHGVTDFKRYESLQGPMKRKLNIRRSSIEQHPQREMIISALLAGRPVREIAAITLPRVSHMALQRFRSRAVLPAVQHAATNTKRLNRNPVQKALQGDSNTAEVLDVAQADIQHQPILAVREERLKLLQDRHDRLSLIAHERATELAEIPGGKSGFLTKDGRDKYKVDGVLLGEMRELEKAAAIETGGWRETANPIGPVLIVVPQPKPNAQEEMEKHIRTLALPPRRA